VVYRGRDLRTRRSVAVRTLRTAYRSDPGYRATFRQETRYQALANHGNIARVYDLHEEQDAPWAVMELVPGQTLAALLREHGPYQPGDAADLLDQVASALAHLHGRQVVHLDVKPDNLIVGPDGTVKLIDFGLAQPSGKPANLISGNAFGTAAYLAPEQITGDPVGPAADTYALACVAYEVITGEPPFGAVAADDPDPAGARSRILRGHLDTAPAPPSQVRPDLDIPPALDDIVLWALAKRPDERYTDVTAFARLFRGALEPLGDDATTAPISWEVPSAAPPPQRTEAARQAPADHLPYQPPRSAAEARIRWDDHSTPPTVRAPAQPAPQPWAAAAAPAVAPYPDRRAAPAPGPGEGWSPEARPGMRGGRALRRLRRLLVRLLVVAVLANLLLFAVLVVTRGAAATLPFQPGIARGAAAETTSDQTNVRAEPDRDAAVAAALADGTALTVTGDAERGDDGFLWWPVRAGGVEGWVREDLLRAEPDTWYERLSVDASDGIDGALDPIRDSIPDLPDIPGL
jgi:eukaryotic-like serine/threonine-protein kinase